MLQPHTHDVRAMSGCVPTADVSLHRSELPLRADFVVEVAGEPGPDRTSGISRPAAGKNATFTFRN